MNYQGIVMNPILAVLKEHNVTDAQTKDVFQALTDNPLMAMATIQALGIPQEKLQPVMFAVMQNPQLIKEAVDELGLDFSKVEAAKAAVQEASQK